MLRLGNSAGIVFLPCIDGPASRVFLHVPAKNTALRAVAKRGDRTFSIFSQVRKGTAVKLQTSDAAMRPLRAGTAGNDLRDRLIPLQPDAKPAGFRTVVNPKISDARRFSRQCCTSRICFPLNPPPLAASQLFDQARLNVYWRRPQGSRAWPIRSTLSRADEMRRYSKVRRSR